MPKQKATKKKRTKKSQPQKDIALRVNMSFDQLLGVIASGAGARPSVLKKIDKM
jgi:hypothetical protein